MMDLKIAIVGFGFLLVQVGGTDDWGYESDNGPNTWADNFTLCGGDMQSPINIVTEDAMTDDVLPIVDRSIFYSPPTKMTVYNNGHALVINFNEGAYTINDRNLLPFEARIAQYHFHWGSATRSGNTTTTTPGSEHTKNGRQYFGELHAVHFNTAYENISVAADKSDGLAVFGWFIDITYPQTNQDMEHLLDIAIQYADMKDETYTVMSTFSLETLLPPDLNVYYRYKGSLTTPRCYESALWTVFDDPIEITEEQAFLFANSFYSTTTNSTILIDNFRPVQDLNGRVVTKPRALVQSGSAVRPSVILALLGSAMAYYI